MSLTETFFGAIASGDGETVRSLLAEDESLLHLRDEAGGSAVTAAIYNGRKEIAQELIERGASLDLHDAAISGSLTALKERLTAGDPVDSFSADGFTALQGASYFGQVESVRALLEAGADVNVRSKHFMTLLAINAAAAHKGHDANSTEISRLLLDAGSDVNAICRGGYTPLHAAMQNHNVELTALLLERGADPTIQSDEGKTAQQYADETQPQL